MPDLIPSLTLSCLLAWPGGSLQLEDEANGYELEVASFGEVATGWRRHEVENQWVEGAFTVGAVKENLSLPLAVYVTAPTGALLQTRLKALTDALDRLAWTMTFVEGGVSTQYKCQVSDYTTTRSQAYRVARHALVRASVPCSPTPLVT